MHKVGTPYTIYTPAYLQYLHFCILRLLTPLCTYTTYTPVYLHYLHPCVLTLPTPLCIYTTYTTVFSTYQSNCIPYSVFQSFLPLDLLGAVFYFL